MKGRFLKIIGFLLGIFLVISLTRSIVDAWQKGGLLDREEERFAKAKLENEELNRESVKLQSPEYIEKQARDKLGLGKEGEAVVVLPPLPTITVPEGQTNNSEKSQSVWQQWVSFLFN